MEQTYFLIILGALLFEYGLSTISSLLNMTSISKVVPDGFQDYYNEEKYVKSQLYLKDKTKLGLFSSTLSLILILVVIQFGLFGKIDEFVRSNSDHNIISGLLFFGILFFINDIINLPI
ncbi:MAG: peptidase M48, partial [Candidatus Marinimicrobia bacterium]|nr:peptidase M48 [Candidatus Neomarinimicrobiota bacterium]